MHELGCTHHPGPPIFMTWGSTNRLIEGWSGKHDRVSPTHLVPVPERRSPFREQMIDSRKDDIDSRKDDFICLC